MRWVLRVPRTVPALHQDREGIKKRETTWAQPSCQSLSPERGGQGAHTTEEDKPGGGCSQRAQAMGSSDAASWVDVGSREKGCFLASSSRAFPGAAAAEGWGLAMGRRCPAGGWRESSSGLSFLRIPGALSVRRLNCPRQPLLASNQSQNREKSPPGAESKDLETEERQLTPISLLLLGPLQQPASASSRNLCPPPGQAVSH